MASDLESFRPMLVVADGVSGELAAILYRSAQLMTPALIERLYRRFTAGTVRRLAPELESVRAEVETHGAPDAFCILGSDPSGHGCGISIGMSAPHDPGRDELAVFR
jgi:hypothetical protein